ncbi:MAG: cupin domain-containing protein [Planctomycetota bacterium]|jgi:quercetin dioxygenase-like cupin family protein
MNIINAIAKVRFATAKPQRVQLHKDGGLVLELLCLEAGQEITIKSGQWAHYIVTGTAELTENGQTKKVPTGQLAITEPDKTHTIANTGEGRLVVLTTAHLS